MKKYPSLGKTVLLVIAILAIYCKKREINPPVENVDDKAEIKEVRYVKAKGGLRLRSEPNSKSKILAIIPECSHVFRTEQSKETETIDGMRGFWAKLQYLDPKKKSIEGWGFEPYLSIEIPEVPVTRNDMVSFKAGCLNITGEGHCMGCESIDFLPNGTFRIAYDCHLLGDGTWQIKDDKILVESNQYIGGCGHFADREKCEKAPKGPSVRYEFKLSANNSWLIKTDSDQWKSKDFLHWSKEWNSVGKMYCRLED